MVSVTTSLQSVRMTCLGDRRDFVVTVVVLVPLTLSALAFVAYGAMVAVMGIEGGATGFALAVAWLWRRDGGQPLRQLRRLLQPEEAAAL